MSRDIDPFEDDEIKNNGLDDAPVSNRLGMSNVRQALTRWWIILIFAILGYLGALYYISIIPSMSEAIAVLEVDTKNRVLIGRDLEEGNVELGTHMSNIANRISGPSVLQAIVESPEVQALQNAIPPKNSLKPRYWRSEEELAFKPASSVPSHELVKGLVEWLKISARKDTSMLEVIVSHPDAESARVLADAVVSVYMEIEESRLVDNSSDAFKLLKAESEEARQSTEKAENSLQVYVSALKLNEQIQQKRGDLIALRQRYKLKHPARIQFEAMYADLLERFRREIKRSSSEQSEQDYWLEYKETMTMLEAQIEAGGEDTAQISDEWLAIAQNALSSRSNTLNAAISHERTIYESITKRMTEIDLGGEGKMNDLTIVENAYIGKAAESVRLVNLAMGSLIGAFIGFGFAYLLSAIDYKVYDVRSAEEATGLTCLAAVPASSKFEHEGAWESILTHDLNSANAESIRNLRASIILLGKKDRNKVLLVTSSIPGEGKTTISAELAAAFALNKERTLLVDMDLRRPRLTSTFPILKGARGMVDVLAGQVEMEDVFRPTDIPNLTVVGSGNKAPNPSELLHEAEFAELLGKLTDKFDRIILDSAPVLPVSDSRLLARHAGAVVLVVRSRKTPIGAVMRSRDLLKASGARMGGVVVNGMKRSSSNSYHGYKGFGEYGADEYGYYGDDD